MDKGESHLNEGEVTADNSVLLLDVINLSSVGLGWKEKGKRLSLTGQKARPAFLEKALSQERSQQIPFY